jgi:hypothetical protein
MSRRPQNIHPCTFFDVAADNLALFRERWTSLKNRMADLGVPRRWRKFSRPMEWICDSTPESASELEHLKSIKRWHWDSVFDHVVLWTGPGRRGLTTDPYCGTDEMHELLTPLAKCFKLHLEIYPPGHSAYYPGQTTTAILVETESRLRLRHHFRERSVAWLLSST